MSDSISIDGANPCTCTGPADGDTAADFRAHLQRWLTNTVTLNSDRESDLVLAAYEAMANCAEHAYSDDGQANSGTMTLSMRHDPVSEAVEVAVTDRGSWVERDSDASDAIRGRGLMLMHSLAEECHVRSRSEGTTVRLRFNKCRALHGTAAPGLADGP